MNWVVSGGRLHLVMDSTVMMDLDPIRAYAFADSLTNRKFSGWDTVQFNNGGTVSCFRVISDTLYVGLYAPAYTKYGRADVVSVLMELYSLVGEYKKI